MKKKFTSFAVLVSACLFITACKKQEHIPAPATISEETLSQIKALGFGTSSVQVVEQGYIVEGDILLTPQFLKTKPVSQLLRIGKEEQYRTSNTVLALPRTIYVRVSTSLPSMYVTALDAALARYNALNLLIRFARVTSGGSIVLTPSPSGAGYLASSGFPDDYGNPFYQILINRGALDSWNANTKITVLAHELGHCIGMRHSDYYNRAISCGGTYTNEGASTVGAKYIPGTPGYAENGSWMLACLSNGTNRPFTNADKIALNFLY